MLKLLVPIIILILSSCGTTKTEALLLHLEPDEAQMALNKICLAVDSVYQSDKINVKC